MSLIIKPGYSKKQYWIDLFNYRDLFYYLAWRDILVRYKQTVIGVTWALLQPLLTVTIFTFVFGRLAQLDSDGVPYFLLVLTGFIPWQFFAAGFSESSNSLIANSNLITKVYFPRMIIPISAIVVFLVDMSITLSLMALMMLYLGVGVTFNILFLPIVVFAVFLLTASMGMIIGSLNVKYRDFRYVVPFMVQIGMYISPVGYTTSIIPEKWATIYYLNPMAGIIDAFRWCILGTDLFISGIAISTAGIVILSVYSFVFFRNSENKFSDII